MAFSLYGLAVALHVLGAILWVGGTAMLAFVVIPALRKNGDDHVDALLLAVARRGGFGAYFVPVLVVTFATGAYAYWYSGRLAAPFAGASATLLTLGALLGAALLPFTLAVTHPAEKRLVALARQHGAGPLPAEARGRFHEVAEAMGKRLAIGSPLLFGALLLMLASRVV